MVGITSKALSSAVATTAAPQAALITVGVVGLQYTVGHNLVSTLKFCRYEGALGIGVNRGFSWVVVPERQRLRDAAYEHNRMMAE